MKRFFVTIILTLIYSTGFSQIFRDPKNIFPYAPETSGLLKYQETPVSNYTGIPNISIPIYTVKSGSVEVPISLSYHAGGILVSEIASSVGLGWSISTVAPITRKINGYTDENGVMRHDNNIDSFLNDSFENQRLKLVYGANGLFNQSTSDLMSDEFSMSLDEFSGSFFYNPKNKKIATFPLSDLKIDYYTKAIDPVYFNRIDTINVIGTNGIKYIFGGDGVETYNLTGSMSASNYFGVNTWKIKKIKGTDNREITFSYLNNGYFKRDLAPKTKIIPYTNYSFSTGCTSGFPTDPINPVETEIQYETKEALIQKIETNEAIINFVYSNRLDFNDLKKLDKIIIKNKAGQIISEKRFNYGYFETIPEAVGVSDPTEDVTKRLKLLSYQECDRDGKCITTSFEYYEQNKMTQRNSYSSDHWGYYNGKLNNSGYPNVPVRYYTFEGNSMYTVDGFTKDLESPVLRIADKEVDPEFTKTFSLKSITYPGGGKNEYIYEPNTASSLLYQPNDEHYFLSKKKVIEKGELFVISGTVQGYDINYSQMPTTSDGSVKTFVKEIDLSNYDKELKLSIKYKSTFNAQTLSNSLDSNYLHADYGIYYYENGVKKYWFTDSPMNSNEIVVNFHKLNNAQVPIQKIYIEIKHTYWGGLNPTGNISDYMYFYSQVGFSWEEADPNAVVAPIIFGGGIRIKEIKQYDNGQYKYSTKYSYVKEGNPQLSSGILFNIPMYTKNNRLGRVASSPCPGNGSFGVIKNVQDAIELSVRPAITGMRTQGKTIGYTNVEVIRTDAQNNNKGKEIYQYYVEPPLQTGDNFLATTEGTSARYEFMESRDWRNGHLLKRIVLNNTNDTIKTVNRDFYLSAPPSASINYLLERNVKMILSNLISPIDYMPGGLPLRTTNQGASMLESDVNINGIFPSYIGVNTTISPHPFPIFVRHNDAFLLKKETTTDYFTSGRKKTKISEYFYEDALYPTRLTSKKDSFSGEDVTINTSYKYSPEKGNQKLITANMIGIPLETQTTQTMGTATKTISKVETKYDSPLNLLPSSVISTDLQNVVSTEVTYDQYDNKGNLQQYTTKDGLSTVIIWGYNKTQPIAKIEGAKLTDISQSLIDSIVNASNTDASAAANNDEASFLSVLNTFRNSLPNYQITTYTYDPLIGVRSITPPSGIREVYLYDSANRLKEIRENSQTGNLLKEFKYNYKQ